MRRCDPSAATRVCAGGDCPFGMESGGTPSMHSFLGTIWDGERCHEQLVIQIRRGVCDAILFGRQKDASCLLSLVCYCAVARCCGLSMVVLGRPWHLMHLLDAWRGRLLALRVDFCFLLVP